ncbi:MAG: hypothetical protein ACRDFX_13585, partial [Chloroflexota bacterium]
ADLTDVRAERDRLLKELAEAERLHGVAAAKLGNDSFRSRAPAEVVSREEERLASLTQRRARLHEGLLALEK